jgi:hypothetical protein
MRFQTDRLFFLSFSGPNVAFEIKTNIIPWVGSKKNIWGGSGGGTRITFFYLLLMLLLLPRRHAKVKS